MLSNIIADTQGGFEAGGGDETRNTFRGPWRLSESGFLDSVAGEDDTGLIVDEHLALECAAINSAVTLVAETLAMLPLKFYVERNGSREPSAHPVARLFRFTHDGVEPSMRLIETVTRWALTYGVGYARIVRGGRLPVALELVHPSRVHLVRTREGATGYVVSMPDGSREPLLVGELLRVQGPSDQDNRHQSRIWQSRRAIALLIASERYSGSYFTHGASPSFGLEHPAKLTDETRERIQRSLDANVGFKRAHRIFVAEEGMKIVASGADPNKSQLVETRNMQLLEICRVFRIPPRLLMAELGGMSYANLTQDNAAFVQLCLLPWAKRWTAEIELRLLPANDVYCEFVFDALLSGTTNERYDAYAKGLDKWLTRDEIRQRENLPAWPESETLDLATAPYPGASNQPQSGTPETAARSLRPIFRDAVARLLTRQGKALGTAASRKLAKNRGEYERWANTFTAETRQIIAETLAPLAEATARLTGQAVRPGYVVDRAGLLADQLRARLVELQTPAAAREQAQLWTEPTAEALELVAAAETEALIEALTDA